MNQTPTYTKDEDVAELVGIKQQHDTTRKTQPGNVDGSVVESIARRLAEKIPAPYKPPPKPRKSWLRLRPGQRLRSCIDLGSILAISRGSEAEVTSCDSEGVWLQLTKPNQLGTMRVRWTEPWEGSWERVKTGRKRKADA